MREDGTRRLLELALRASRRYLRRRGTALQADAGRLARALWSRYWVALGGVALREAALRRQPGDDHELLEDEP